MISSLSDLVAAQKLRRQRLYYYTSNGGAWLAGSPFALSWWNTVYPAPGNHAPPSECPSATTLGAFPLTLRPRPGRQLFLGASKLIFLHTQGQIVTQRIGVRLCDRLYHCAFNPITNGTVSINGPTVTRGAANGVGNEIYIEVNGNPGGGNIGVTYINQDGEQKQTSTTAPMGQNDTGGGRWLPCARAVGDTGVQSIVSVQCNALNFVAARTETVVIVREIGHMFSVWPPQTNRSDPTDALENALAPIDDQACLMLVAESPTASPDTPSVITGWFDVIEA